MQPVMFGSEKGKVKEEGFMKLGPNNSMIRVTGKIGLIRSIMSK